MEEFRGVTHRVRQLLAARHARYGAGPLALNDEELEEVVIAVLDAETELAERLEREARPMSGHVTGRSQLPMSRVSGDGPVSGDGTAPQRAAPPIQDDERRGSVGRAQAGSSDQ